VDFPVIPTPSGRALSDELPPNDQTLDFVFSTLTDLADLGTLAKLRDS
jgi:hypothetical protein